MKVLIPHRDTGMFSLFYEVLWKVILMQKKKSKLDTRSLSHTHMQRQIILFLVTV